MIGIADQVDAITRQKEAWQIKHGKIPLHEPSKRRNVPCELERIMLQPSIH